MKLKKINWIKQDNILIAKVLGYTLTVVQNNGKWDSRLVADNIRPEIQSGFDTVNEAKRYAEKILLHREMSKHIDTGDEWIDIKKELPKADTTVLVYGNYGKQKDRIYTARQSDGSFYTYLGLDELQNITHWYPLPQPPKG